MAQIFPDVRGEPIERVIARTEEVQDALLLHTQRAANEASTILFLHRVTGDSFIEIKKGSIDYWLILNDTRGLQAAMTIEFGRTKRSRKGPSEPVAPLRRAVGLK